MKKQFRTRRIFDENLKREVVKQVEKGKLSPSCAAREYDVAIQTIYKWLYKYSKYLAKSDTIVVKKKDQDQTNQELKKQIAELQSALGRKQMEVEYLEKLIEIASKEEGIDLKKNFGSRFSGGSNPSNTNTDGK